MLNIVKNYFRFLEVISSLNCDLECKFSRHNRIKICKEEFETAASNSNNLIAPNGLS